MICEAEYLRLNYFNLLRRPSNLSSGTRPNSFSMVSETSRRIRPSCAICKRRWHRCRVSQPVFARYLNTNESTVEKWETGAKQPSGIALKLLFVVEKHGLEALT
jgi:DNA-binding transcriptional regulator YiaG